MTAQRTPADHIAGVVAGSGRVPAAEVAERILARLSDAGYRIVEGEASTAPSAAEVPAEAVDWVADVVRRTVAEVVRVQAAGNAQFDLAAIRSAYEAGYVRASYDCGGQPADLGGDHYRYVEAADLRPWQGDGPWEATLAREHAAA